MSKEFDYKTVTVKKHRWDIEGCLEGDIDTVIEKLTAMRDESPDEKLSVVFESEYDYDGTERRKPFLMTTRLETFTEFCKREQNEKRLAEQRLAQKRADFERLKAELGEQ